MNLSSVGGFERCWEDRRSPSGWHLRQEAAASLIEQGQRTGLGAIVCERMVASGAKCRDGAASWHGAPTIKPSPSAQQSPEEKDDEHNDHDTGLATAEIQCNEHQLHSNSLRPTQRRQNRIGSEGQGCGQSPRVGGSLCVLPSLRHQIPGDDRAPTRPCRSIPANFGQPLAPSLCRVPS